MSVGSQRRYLLLRDVRRRLAMQESQLLVTPPRHDSWAAPGSRVRCPSASIADECSGIWGSSRAAELGWRQQIGCSVEAVSRLHARRFVVRAKTARHANQRHSLLLLGVYLSAKLETRNLCTQ
jgi:hypothetical protein